MPSSTPPALGSACARIDLGIVTAGDLFAEREARAVKGLLRQLANVTPLAGREAATLAVLPPRVAALLAEAAQRGTTSSPQSEASSPWCAVAAVTAVFEAPVAAPGFAGSG